MNILATIGLATPPLRDHSRDVCVDFDGTIVSHHPVEGQIGEPLPNGLALLKRLHSENYNVHVLTARNDLATVQQWLDKHDVGFARSTNVKPPAAAYLDNRAVNWTGEQDVDKAMGRIRGLSRQMVREKHHMIHAGGPGSGCKGPHCGRPHSSTAKLPSITMPKENVTEFKGPSFVKLYHGTDTEFAHNISEQGLVSHNPNNLKLIHPSKGVKANDSGFVYVTPDFELAKSFATFRAHYQNAQPNEEVTWNAPTGDTTFYKSPDAPEPDVNKPLQRPAIIELKIPKDDPLVATLRRDPKFPPYLKAFRTPQDIPKKYVSSIKVLKQDGAHWVNAKGSDLAAQSDNTHTIYVVFFGDLNDLSELLPEDVSPFGTTEGALRGWETRHSGGAQPSQAFVSPSTGTGTGLDDAERALKSPEHQRFTQRAKEIFDSTPNKAVISDAIGSWKDGAEDALALSGSGKDYAAVRAAAARLGLEYKQKAIAAFQADPKGSDTIWRVNVDNSDHKKISDMLDRFGIQNRTLVPRNDGTEIRIIDPGTSLRDKVREVAKSYGTRFSGLRGKSEFIGGSTRKEGASTLGKVHAGRARGAVGRERGVVRVRGRSQAAQEIAAESNRKLQGRMKFQGLDISIENKKGSVRSGVDAGGKPWRTKMFHPYGRIIGTKMMGMDGDHIDCFVGPNPSAKNAYVITINRPPDFTKPDEHKVMLGFNSAASAKGAFLQHYNNPKFFRSMETKPMSDFKGEILANVGEPEVYDGGYGHIEAIPTFHPPSDKNPKRVPSDDPGETDDTFMDVTQRKSRATKEFRDKQTADKFGAPAKSLTDNRTLIQGFPSVSIGGFG